MSRFNDIAQFFKSLNVLHVFDWRNREETVRGPHAVAIDYGQALHKLLFNHSSEECRVRLMWQGRQASGGEARANVQIATGGWK
jgi:hypothetical protein